VTESISDLTTLLRRKKRKPKPQESSKKVKTWKRDFSVLRTINKIPSTPAAPVFGDLRQPRHMCAETFNSDMMGSDRFS
jgi:hypothetical protein